MPTGGSRNSNIDRAKLQILKCEENAIANPKSRQSRLSGPKDAVDHFLSGTSILYELGARSAAMGEWGAQ